MTRVAAGPVAAGPVAAGPKRRHAVFHSLRVSGVQQLTSDSVCISFAIPPELAEEFTFTAGQHVSVRMPEVAGEIGDDIRRNYSICSPANSPGLRIGVKQIPGGVFSAYATQRLEPGDVLDVMTPTGTFTTRLDPTQSKRYAAIAAGSGITPVLSILATALDVEPDSTAALVFVNRRTSTMMFLEDLEDLKDRYPQRFQLIHVLSEEATEVEMLSGRLDVARLGRIFNTLLPVEDVDEWFLCGPQAMTDAVRRALLDRDVDPTHVHRELFHVGPPVVPLVAPRHSVEAGASGAELTVILDGRTTQLTLPPTGDSVLEALLRSRPDTPFACKNGVCGTCRARVTQGAVAMDSNYALEPEELAHGYVLTCQSHPVSDRVVVDYDQ